MKKTTYIFSLGALLFLASCSTNQDLVRMEEVDDLYYSPTVAAVTEPNYETDSFIGANSAESSYYGQSPFVDEEEKPSAQIEAVDESESDDYYDPDYARRIDNFHRSEEEEYIYNDAFANNMAQQPQWNVNMGFTAMNGWNGWGMGVSYGMPMGYMGMRNPWMGNRWCDPFWDPFCRCPWGGSRWSMGIAYNPWGSPWGMGWGGAWGMYDPFNPWYNPWGNPWMGGGVVVVDGNGSGFQNTPRTGTGRQSRGGMVDNGSSRSPSTLDGSKANTSAVERGNRTRTVDANRTRMRPLSTSDEDYYNRTESRQYTRNATQTTRQSNQQYTRPNTRSIQSPYTRQQEQRRNPASSTYSRSRSNRNYNSTRSTPSRSTFSTPGRSRSSSPSLSNPPSRSVSPSYSPSRSGGGTRRR